MSYFATAHLADAKWALVISFWFVVFSIEWKALTRFVVRKTVEYVTRFVRFARTLVTPLITSGSVASVAVYIAKHQSSLPAQAVAFLALGYFTYHFRKKVLYVGGEYLDAIRTGWKEGDSDENATPLPLAPPLEQRVRNAS